MIFSDILNNVRRLVEDEASFRWTDKTIAEYVVEGVNEIKRKTGDASDRIPFNFVEGQSVYQLNTTDGTGQREHGRVVAVHILPENTERTVTLTQIGFHDLPATSYEEDGYTDDIPTLLVKSDTYDGSQFFTDSSPNGYELDVLSSANTIHSTEQAKFGTSSIKMQGSLERIITPSGADVHLSADFTFDEWVYLNSTTNQRLFEREAASNSSYYLDVVSSTQVSFGYSTDGLSFSTVDFEVPTIATGVWKHIALERSGNTLNLFFDGVLVGSESFTATIFDGIGRLEIGALVSVDYYFDEFRFVNGKAVYGGVDFDPPTEPYFTGNVRIPATLSNDPTAYALTTNQVDGTMTDYQSIYFNAPAPRSTDGDPFGFFVDVKREFVFVSDASATTNQLNTLIPVLPKFDRHLTNLVAGHLFMESNDLSYIQKGQLLQQTAMQYISDIGYVNSISNYVYQSYRPFP